MAINLDPAPEEMVYNAIIQRVQTDPKLSKVCGEIYATPFRFDPPPIQLLPMIRIEAGAGPINSYTMVADRTSLLIGFVLQVANGDHRDMMRLWNALRRCINVHRDQWMDQALAGVADLSYHGMSWKQAAITYQPIPKTRALESSAVLEILLAIKDC